MKRQEDVKGGQGRPTSDRTFTDHKQKVKQRDINNGGGQRTDQTSNRDNDRKQANKRRQLL